MTGKELAALVMDGICPVVTFTKRVEDQESYLEGGMRGRLIAVMRNEEEYISLAVDLTEFDDFNRQYEKANYYDKSGVARLTAREAGFYKPVESVYVGPADEVDVLQIEDAASLKLYERYQADSDGKSYVQWLEQKLVVLERTADTAPLHKDAERYRRLRLMVYAEPGDSRIRFRAINFGSGATALEMLDSAIDAAIVDADGGGSDNVDGSRLAPRQEQQ